MTLKEFTAPVSGLRLYRGGELSSGDIIRSVSPYASFSVGLVLHQSEVEGGPVIASLDGDHPLTFWRYEPDMCFLRLVASGDLSIRFDPTQTNGQRPHVPGVISLITDDAWLCLAASEHGMPRPRLLSLRSWTFSQPRFEDGHFIAYNSWSLGYTTVDGRFVAAASVSAP
jgi:hypothetical protein